MEGVEGEKVLVSAKEDEVVEKIVVENVVEVEKDLKVQEGVSCCNCDAQMTLNHQCEAGESDSSWEDIENEQELYPTLDMESDDWAEKFTNNIRDYHGVNN